MSKLQFLVGTVLIATTASCSGPAAGPGPTGCPACPVTRMASHLRSGTLTYSLDGAAPKTVTVGSSGSADSCAASAWLSLGGPESPVAGVTSGFGLGCSVPEGSLDINGWLPDRRSLGVGSYPLVLPPTFVNLKGSTVICGGAPAMGPATLQVTSAAGGAAAYPAATSPDYAREFTVHLESTTPSERTGDCVAPAVSVTLDLQFDETSADAVNMPEQICGCG